MFGISVNSRSEIGRRSRNEDKVRVSREGPLWVAVLSDGAGGHQGGAEASRRVVDHVEAALHAVGAVFGADALARAVRSAHAQIREEQAQQPALRDMHATVVVLWIDSEQDLALWSHAGDSRLYLARGGALRRLTTDDSVVQSLLDAGLLSPQQAESHPHKNQLTAALGMAGEIEPHTPPRPIPLHDGDAFLLCSDGWWGSLDDAGMFAALGDAESPEDWLEAMRQRIEARAGPLQDNFSAIAVWVGDRSEITRPLPD